ncbi:MAG: NHLP leader peptide family RiPP precursor [Bacteroidales bacterium]|nr:NHLP leader peptide family RiPP precursor [Bacteroidales bacterium]
METMNRRQQLEQRIIEKAIKDEQFRERLMTSPNETIEQELGVKLPASLRINVLEEKPNSFYLVIPMATRELSDEELTEAELSNVAGGYGSAPSDDTQCGSNDINGICV